MASCTTEAETVSRMEKAGNSIVVAAISQWRRRLSVNITGIFCGGCMAHCVQLMLS